MKAASFSEISANFYRTGRGLNRQNKHSIQLTLMMMMMMVVVVVVIMTAVMVALTVMMIITVAERTA
jgi:uncharacterized membrane protein YbaN (DUF454 family)